MGAELFLGMTMAWTPDPSADRAIAPMFLTSVIRSRTKIKGVSPAEYVESIIFSRDENTIGLKKAMTP